MHSASCAGRTCQVDLKRVQEVAVSEDCYKECLWLDKVSTWEMDFKTTEFQETEDDERGVAALISMAMRLHRCIWCCTAMSTLAAQLHLRQNEPREKPMTSFGCLGSESTLLSLSPGLLPGGQYNSPLTFVCCAPLSIPIIKVTFAREVMIHVVSPRNMCHYTCPLRAGDDGAGIDTIS